MLEIEKWLEVAENAAIAAGQRILEIYHEGSFEIENKQHGFPVTAADKAAQEIIFEYLRQTSLPVISEECETTDFAIRKSWEYCWLVDPLDGTKEFIAGSGEFTVNIALIHKSRPVAGVVYIPCHDTLYVGSELTGVYKLQTGTRQKLVLPKTTRTRFEDLSTRSPLRIVASRFHLSDKTKEFIQQFPDVDMVTAGSSLKFILLLEGKADMYPRLGTTMEWDTAAAHAILNSAHIGVYMEDLTAELFYNKPDLSNPYFIAY